MLPSGCDRSRPGPRPAAGPADSTGVCTDRAIRGRPQSEAPSGGSDRMRAAHRRPDPSPQEPAVEHLLAVALVLVVATALTAVVIPLATRRERRRPGEADELLTAELSASR